MPHPKEIESPGNSQLLQSIDVIKNKDIPISFRLLQQLKIQVSWESTNIYR